MRARKSFLIRIDPLLHSALERWAKDDLRSLNGQIEFLLKDALRRKGVRLPEAVESSEDLDAGSSESEPEPSERPS